MSALDRLRGWETMMLALLGAIVALNSLGSPYFLSVGNFVNLFQLSIEKSIVALTMLADTLYTMLARKLRGFEDCDAPKLYRHFVHGKATVSVTGTDVVVSFPRRAHNPILRAVPWHNLPGALLAPNGATLTLRFA